MEKRILGVAAWHEAVKSTILKLSQVVQKEYPYLIVGRPLTANVDPLQSPDGY